MKKQYPLYDSKNKLVGNCELDSVHTGDYGKHDLVLYYHDLNGNCYEVSAWAVSRIINFSDPNMPRTYARLA